MKTFKCTLVQILAFALTTSVLAACSVDLTGAEAIPPVDLYNGKPRVDGPQAAGDWTTTCYPKNVSNSGKISLTLKGDTFIRSTETFEDAFCQVSKTKNTYTGTFIFTEKFNDGSYAIYYAMNLGSGVTQFTEEKVLLEGDILFISNSLLQGADVPVDRNIPMKKAGNWTTATCQNYAGKYQMNNEYLEIAQKGCEMIIINLETYLLDGVARSYQGGKIKAGIYNDLLKREYKNNLGEAILEQWSYQTRPCQLSNPSSEKLLTREAWVNGSYAYDQCRFYSKIK